MVKSFFLLGHVLGAGEQGRHPSFWCSMLPGTCGFTFLLLSATGIPTQVAPWPDVAKGCPLHEAHRALYCFPSSLLLREAPHPRQAVHLHPSYPSSLLRGAGKHSSGAGKLCHIPANVFRPHWVQGNVWTSSMTTHDVGEAWKWFPAPPT